MSKRSFLFLLSICFTFTLFTCHHHYSVGREVPTYELNVSIFPYKHRIAGTGKISVSGDVEGHISLHKLDVARLQIGGKLFTPDEGSRVHPVRISKGQRVEIEFEAKILPEKEREAVENVGVTGSNIIDSSGIMLLSDWYPSFSGPTFFSLEVTLPSDFDVISESDTRTETIDHEKDLKTVKFSFSHPVPGITLVGGRYTVHHERFRGIDIRTYFYPGDSYISPVYMDNMKKFIELYEGMFGEYPYRSFSIVENVFQTGYSFPTYTLLGSRIVTSPYIPEISLGHEYLHQWFGHYVDVDYQGGNWSEGLTTYLADHWYKELQGRGYEYRKKTIIDYMNYVSPGQDMAIIDFRGRTDFATRAIGYGKTAMVFHMLRKKIGDEAFFNGLRRFIENNAFKRAGWEELGLSFGGRDDEETMIFFDRWIKERGMASLTIEPPVVVQDGGKHLLTMDVTQENGPYIFDLPVTIETHQSKETYSLPLNGKTVTFEKLLDERPTRAIIDQNYDTFRCLTKDETPAVISRFTGDKTSLVIIPDSDRNSLRGEAEFFKTLGYAVLHESEVDDETLQRSSLLILSGESKRTEIFQGKFEHTDLPRGDIVVKVVKNPWNHEKVAVLFIYRDVQRLYGAYRKIFRYGNYSLLTFEKGKNDLKETEHTARGIIFDLDAETAQKR